MIPWLGEAPDFPPVGRALRDPPGLLAAGGSLAPEWLLEAYPRGIFPWFSAGEPILWWSPDPRLVLLPSAVKVSRSLRKVLRQQRFEIRFDTAFRAVVSACAAPRVGASGTWITARMQEAYGRMHELGHAHSVEAWVGGELVGGLYGISVGRAFFGESMFSLRSDASKACLVYLAHYLESLNFGVIDCQMTTAHLLSLGAQEISREAFCRRVAVLARDGPGPARWAADAGAGFYRNRDD